MKANDTNTRLVNIQADLEEKNNLQGYNVNILIATSNFPAQKWMKSMKILKAKMKKLTNTDYSHTTQ
jgi:hypothetical protein